MWLLVFAEFKPWHVLLSQYHLNVRIRIVHFAKPNSQFFIISSTDVMKSADRALDALKRMRAGMKANNALSRKQAREEVSRVFNKRARIDRGNENKPAWLHKFVCLAYMDQDRMPMTDYDKEELYQAGLGEKEIAFESLKMSQQQFKDLLLKEFPRLKDGGGFQLLKGL